MAKGLHFADASQAGVTMTLSNVKGKLKIPKYSIEQFVSNLAAREAHGYFGVGVGGDLVLNKKLLNCHLIVCLATIIAW